MWIYALKRIAGLVPVLFVAVLITFVAIQFVPGDPVQVMLSDHSGNVELEKRLKAILAGEPPFDIFVRWKPLAQQPISWEPDINDGVRLNIRPFMAQDIPGGKKGAGILRAKPNIHWKKDRGKEPVRERAQYPWFWGEGKFTGERVNDIHLTVAEKRAARDRAEEPT